MAKFGIKPRSDVQESQSPAPTADEQAQMPVATAAAVDVNPTQGATMAFPGEEVENADKPHMKDGLLNDHQYRLQGKRRFLMDALCRALNCDMYLLEADKPWAPNPLGKGDNVSIRYSREFPTIHVMFDQFAIIPSAPLLEMKRDLAHQHGYKYLYETPEHRLNHERLDELMQAQKHVVHPEAQAKIDYLKNR